MKGLFSRIHALKETVKSLVAKLAKATEPTQGQIRLNPLHAFRVQKQPHYSGRELQWLRTRKRDFGCSARAGRSKFSSPELKSAVARSRAGHPRPPDIVWALPHLRYLGQLGRA